MKKTLRERNAHLSASDFALVTGQQVAATRKVKVRGEPNKLEMDAKRWIQEHRLASPDEWKFNYEEISFGTGANKYTPDWMVVFDHGGTLIIEFYEVKGTHSNRRESRSKWKEAAARHQWARWYWMEKKSGFWYVDEAVTK